MNANSEKENFMKKCQYCNKEITTKMNIYFVYDNPTCSYNCSYLMMFEINRRDPSLSKPELWSLKRS